MKTNRLLITLLAIVFLANSMARGEEKDEGIISIDEAPAAVREAIVREANGGTIVEIRKKTNDGNIVYKAELVTEGKRSQIKLAENGEFLSRETKEEKDSKSDKSNSNQEPKKQVKVAIDDVPAAVKETFVRETKGGAIDKIEKEGDGDTATFKAKTRVDGKQIKLKVAADGTLLSKKMEVSKEGKKSKEAKAQ
jgi:hypothetical protein